LREDVSRLVYDSPHILSKGIEIKPKDLVEVRMDFPVRKVTIE
jgi:hypothetical protein